jgi:hypothetical protein
VLKQKMTRAGFAQTATLEFPRGKAIRLPGTQFEALTLEGTFITLVGRLFRARCFD